MARQVIDTTTNNGTYIGDPAKTAFEKVNGMTGELYPLAYSALQKEGGTMTGQLNSDVSLGISIRGSGFSGISIFPTGAGGRDYRLASTDNSNGFGGGKLFIYDQSNNRVAYSLDEFYNLAPGAYNQQSIGLPSYRWSVVYAATGSINTSDAREKTEVIPFNNSEIAAAKAIAKEIGFYKFLSSISEKGDLARWHPGMTVQKAIEIMESYGLNPFRYSFICHDSWESTPSSDEYSGSPSGDRYGFRPEELMMFIAKGLEARISELENRIND